MSRTALILATILLAMSLAPRAAVSADGATPSLTDLAARAEAVVVGRVETVEPAWNNERTLIATKVTLAVERAWGRQVGRRVEVFVLGGRLDDEDVGLFLPDEARFRPEERVVVFLASRPGGGHRLVGRRQGKLMLPSDQPGRLIRPDRSVADLAGLENLLAARFGAVGVQADPPDRPGPSPLPAAAPAKTTPVKQAAPPPAPESGGEKVSPPATSQPSAAPAGEASGQEARGARLVDFLGAWIEAWESRDVDRHIAFYAPEFHSGGMDRAAWRAHKARLAARYSFISVEISDVAMKLAGETAEVTFKQRYRSDRNQETGLKTLALRLVQGAWLIEEETWRPL